MLGREPAVLYGVVLILSVLTFTACATGGDDRPATDASSTATASAGGGLERWSGIAEVDQVLAALLGDDMTQIRALLVETPRPCVEDPRDLIHPPRCPEGVPPGTMVPVFRALAGEAVWPDDFDRLLNTWITRPRSVYAVYRGAVGNHWLPGAEYAIVVKDDQRGHGNVIHVTDGKIVGWLFTTNRSPESLVQGVAPGRFVLPPA